MDDLSLTLCFDIHEVTVSARWISRNRVRITVDDNLSGRQPEVFTSAVDEGSDVLDLCLSHCKRVREQWEKEFA